MSRVPAVPDNPAKWNLNGPSTIAPGILSAIAFPPAFGSLPTPPPPPPPPTNHNKLDLEKSDGVMGNFQFAEFFLLMLILF